MSVTLRQFQKAKKFFLVIERNSLNRLQTFLQLVLILRDNGFTRNFLNVSVDKLRRAEVPASFLENIFNALLESRQGNAEMRNYPVRNGIVRAVQRVEIKNREIIFVQKNFIAAQKINVKIFMAHWLECTFQLVRNFLQRFNQDAAPRSFIPHQNFSRRADFVNQTCADFFVLNGSNVRLQRRTFLVTVHALAENFNRLFQQIR